MADKPIQQVQDKFERAFKEEEILKFWKENKIFSKSLEKKSPKGEFVFYDGPPFATGLPHSGSLLSSVIKDVVPRYKTMRGYHVRRRWGWDCHGLPIENMIEKELGIKDKTEIEGKLGIKAFNKACRDSVLRFAKDWKNYIERVGRWVEYDNSYKTMDNSYIESVWNGLKKIHDKGLLYEGKKVLLYCPHCQTPIAKAEIAMDNSYRDVTEESVYVKFKVKGEDNTYLLAWTTTPWTLPGNVALAVNPDIDYRKIEYKGEIFLLAERCLTRLFPFGDDPERTNLWKVCKGRDLVGLEYEPIYPFLKDDTGKAFKVYPADFVNTEDGTGIVHTAVMYGEDDYILGQKIDLPMVQLLDQAGHFNEKAPEFIQGQYFKKAEKLIKEDLVNRELLLKTEQNTHSYPHCHRCNTALLYNAISSWFINIQKVKNRMIELNKKINWSPKHLKNGRFLNIVEGAPDWTISRNRYWASPLPIWKDSEGKVYVIGSIEELKRYTKKSGNKYLVMRHGGSESNKSIVVSYGKQDKDNLTKDGREESLNTAKGLKGKVDIIITSPFTRTRETAEIVRQELGLDKEALIEDERLKEVNPGSFDNKSWDEYHKYMTNLPGNWFTHKAPEGESLQDVARRVGEALYDLESKYKDKNILILTHGGVAWLTYVVSGIYMPDGKEHENSDTHVFVKDFKRFNNAEVRNLDFVPLPHNENYELDLHKPYIDEVELVSEEGEPLKRITEVLDGWVESASMPFAEYHYPFENKSTFESRFPGDFIAEYIAQTRTWFYYMHSMAVILFDNIAFKNVVTTGNVLTEDGSKVSKSKGNYTDPLILLDKFGADAFRYYLMSSVVMQAEDMQFKDEEVKEVHNRLLNILWNSFKFYELYADGTPADSRSKNILDKWMLYKLDSLIHDVTVAMESYDLIRASRPVREFVTDLSTWYIRRSRDRFKQDDIADKKSAIATSRYVFKELSKLIAPIMPFIAEDLYIKVRELNDPESVHLCKWPEDRGNKFTIPFFRSFNVGGKILMDMQRTRDIASLGLEARSKADIKVRQPLGSLKIKNQKSKLSEDFLELIREELNVKSVVYDENIEGDIELDTNITPKLREEGKVRELIRTVQDWRKEQGLQPGQRATYNVPSDREIYLKHKEDIEKATQVELT